MRGRVSIAVRAAALASLVVLSSTATVHAIGYWNLPGTIYQWSGHGFGGGYHAPLVLGPITHEGLLVPNEVRLPCAPNPYSCAPYCGYGGNCGVGEPSMMPLQEQPMMAPQPEVAPEPAPRSSLFNSPPIQR